MSENKHTEEKLSAYDRVKLARSMERPVITDYIDRLFDDFIELRGDRLHGEDESILGGIAMFHGIPVTVIGHRKGKNTAENIRYNFGMGSPEGYRKANRLMQQAQKFGRPIITIVDTPGAYPGIDAENHGQSVALAENIATMSCLKTPIIAVITGEGSSGGALALATADKVFMLENSVYSILSPEGFASILWKDASKAPEASEVMKLTAKDLYSFGIIDDIVPEDENMFEKLDEMLLDELKILQGMDETKLLQNRYEKYRTMGSVSHG
ncbi:MAG: acetyl-CoA carboxylase carboxyltransferase subunit alpha [Pseudobutyrivibrio sp.]|nr:acetyl-CoA carboxylase carboxyltransferase subunit alpha [Pseudobutyrivibrio sp.]